LYRKLVARKFMAEARRLPGRPRIKRESSPRHSYGQGDRDWGYDRSRGVGQRGYEFPIETLACFGRRPRFAGQRRSRKRTTTWAAVHSDSRGSCWRGRLLYLPSADSARAGNVLRVDFFFFFFLIHLESPGIHRSGSPFIPMTMDEAISRIVTHGRLRRAAGLSLIFLHDRDPSVHAVVPGIIVSVGLNRWRCLPAVPT